MRMIACTAVLALAAIGCADDGGDRSATVVPSTEVTESGPTTTAGPTATSTASGDCGRLADEYVQTAEALFAAPPSDALLERSRARFTELDALAAAGGCGEAYRGPVCEGLDDLTRAGVLVVFPLVTAQCI